MGCATGTSRSTRLVCACNHALLAETHATLTALGGWVLPTRQTGKLRHREVSGSPWVTQLVSAELRFGLGSLALGLGVCPVLSSSRS